MPALLFNPSRAETSDLERSFVGRKDVLDRLLVDLDDDAVAGRPRHWLIVGPRGIGKSTIVELAARRMTSTGRWDVVRLSEEHYQVASLADLLEQIVAALAGASPFAKETDAVRVEERAVDWLRNRRTQRPILVVIENLGTLFDQIGARDQHRLREILMRQPPIVVLATSTSAEVITDHDAPFFQFFQSFPLVDLTREEVHELVARRFEIDDGEARLEDHHRVSRNVDTMFHFSGGNPRLVLLLVQVLREGLSDDAFAHLLVLLDQVTPYYQSRMKEDVTPQMARVLTDMATAPGASMPSEIALRIRLPVNQVTANINKLVGARLIRAGGRPDKRRRYYEIVDRLFRIWLQMREQRTSRRQLRFLTEFFSAVYEGREAEAAVAIGSLSARYWEAMGAGDDQAMRAARRTLEHVIPIRGTNAREALLAAEPSSMRDAYLPVIANGERTQPQRDEAIVRLMRKVDRDGLIQLFVDDAGGAVSAGSTDPEVRAWAIAAAAMRGQTVQVPQDLMAAARADINVARPMLTASLATLRLDLVQDLVDCFPEDPEIATLDLRTPWRLPERTAFRRTFTRLVYVGLGVEFPNLDTDARRAALAVCPCDWIRFGCWVGVLRGSDPRAQALDLCRADATGSLIANVHHDLVVAAITVAQGAVALDVYAALRESGLLVEPRSPLEESLTVRDAPDRDVALAALHPEVREGVVALLALAEVRTGPSPRR